MRIHDQFDRADWLIDIDVQDKYDSCSILGVGLKVLIT